MKTIRTSQIPKPRMPVIENSERYKNSDGPRRHDELFTNSVKRSRMVAQSVNSARFKGSKSSLPFSRDAKDCPCPTAVTNSPKTFQDSTTYKFVTLIPIWKSIISHIKLLKSTGYVMHQQVQRSTLYALPTLYSCHLQHELIGFYNRVKCLLRGTDCVFK
jgi:hypothetical protein